MRKLDNTKTFYLTKRGFNKLTKEYNRIMETILCLKKEGIPEVMVSEDINEEYVSFTEDMEILKKRANDIKEILSNAVLIERATLGKPKDIVGIGATVFIEAGSGGEKQFTIVSAPEVDPRSGLISNESPFGRSLLGKKLNETFSFLGNFYKVKKIIYNYF